LNKALIKEQLSLIQEKLLIAELLKILIGFIKKEQLVNGLRWFCLQKASFY